MLQRGIAVSNRVHSDQGYRSAQASGRSLRDSLLKIEIIISRCSAFAVISLIACYAVLSDLSQVRSAFAIPKVWNFAWTVWGALMTKRKTLRPRSVLSSNRSAFCAEILLDARQAHICQGSLSLDTKRQAVTQKLSCKGRSR